MERSDAELLARSLIKEWGCDGWRFVWANGKRQLGAVVEGVVPGTAGYIRRELRLSRFLVDLNSEAEVRDVCLHEIAHIKAGLENGHNEHWKAWCLKVGAKPVRCADPMTVKTGTPDFAIVCTKCERQIAKFFRRPRRDLANRFCKHCGYASIGMLRIRHLNIG